MAEVDDDGPVPGCGCEDCEIEAAFAGLVDQLRDGPTQPVDSAAGG